MKTPLFAFQHCQIYLIRDLGCVRSWKGQSHPLYLEPPLPHLSWQLPPPSSLSAQKQPPSHTFTHLLGWQDGKGTRLDLPWRGREGGKDQDKTHKFISVRHKEWNSVFLIVLPVRKVVPHLWGKGVGPGFPLLCAISGGHRNVHRQSQGSEHKHGDATPVVLFPWQLIKGIQQTEGFRSPLHLTYLGYCQAEFDCHHGCSLELYPGVQRHKQKTALCSILAGILALFDWEEKKEKKMLLTDVIMMCLIN